MAGADEVGWTRAQLCAALVLPTQTLDTLERQDIVTPTVARRPRDTRPARYATADAAVVAVAWSAYQLGLRGADLRRFTQQVRRRRDRFHVGWSGLVVWDGHVVDLVPGTWSAPVGSPASAVLAVPLTVVEALS